MRRLIVAVARERSSRRTTRILVATAAALAGAVAAVTVTSQAHEAGARTLASAAGLHAVLNPAAPAELIALVLGSSASPGSAAGAPRSALPW
jgi:hypothetical protein